jgi:hypothetical protein
VGAKSIPSAHELSRETIEIIPGSSPWVNAPRLSYEIHPDNSLDVTLSHWSTGVHDDVIDAKEVFHLKPNTASDVRHLLWRLRPEELKGVEWQIRPVGCPPPPTDTGSDYSVAFISVGPRPGVQDDRVGVFDLPPAQYCGVQSAAQARLLIEQVLHLFPPSKVAAGYKRQMTALNR